MIKTAIKVLIAFLLLSVGYHYYLLYTKIPDTVSRLLDENGLNYYAHSVSMPLEVLLTNKEEVTLVVKHKENPEKFKAIDFNLTVTSSPFLALIDGASYHISAKENLYESLWQ